MPEEEYVLDTQGTEDFQVKTGHGKDQLHQVVDYILEKMLSRESDGATAIVNGIRVSMVFMPDKFVHDCEHCNGMGVIKKVKV
jgi:hypothetical protein